MIYTTPPAAARLAALALLASAALPAPAQAQPPALDKKYKAELYFSEAEEAEYQRRYKIARNRSSADELYVPRGELPGAKDWRPLAKAAPGERTISETAIASAEEYAARNNSTALIIWRDGVVEHEKYFGETERESLLNSFSLAKPLTALAVGRAMELGAIESLDQPVADFVNEWRDDPRRSRILVRHLLDMRPGFLRQGRGAEADDVMSRSFIHPRSEEIIIAEYPVVYEPGERYDYNNAASALVAVLIERATGTPYEEFVGTELLEKIGAPGGTVWLNREGGVAQSGCCIKLPAETFLRMGILTLQDGVWEGQRLLPEGYVNEMRRGTEQNPYYGLAVYPAGRYTERRGWANHDLGLPMVLHGEPYLAGDLYLFDGNVNQVVYMVPSQRLVILRMGGWPPRTKDSEWDNAVLPNTIIAGITRNKGVSDVQSR